jgi:hypothetical protein
MNSSILPASCRQAARSLPQLFTVMRAYRVVVRWCDRALHAAVGPFAPGVWHGKARFCDFHHIFKATAALASRVSMKIDRITGE